MRKCRRAGRLKALVAAAALGAAGALGPAAPGAAHSFLVDANPSAKDHVDSAPKTIKLKFGAGVEPAYSTITIETPDGKVLAQGAVGKPDSPRELTLDAPADLPPARYIVRYSVLSSDGHVVKGNYEFTIDAK
ncbi:MAG TPA: copper resistance CopC family protein [Methylocystis sp.]|nr:copper resistance CopC family protein [Methylocystis sp.]